jgi:cobalt-zinc-cadmium efflux system membrane fusion protein
MKANRILAGLAMVSIACAVHGGPGAHGPGGEHLDAPGPLSNASGLARLPDGSVNVPKLAQRRMGIRTMMPPVEEAAATVELPGRVIMNPNAGGRVQASHGGRLEAGPRGFPVLGQAVRKGEVLVYTRHHADPYAEANQQAQLAELRANRAIAEQRVARLASLEGTVPRKDIDAARAELAGLAERERGIGASVHAREAMVAPVTGVIARADAIAGQVVETGHVLFEIVDPAQLMVEATTTDPTIASRLGAASLQGIPEARLKLLGAARSLREGVLPITFEAGSADKGKGLPLAVGQPVTVIATLQERVKGIRLPAQAVVRNAANEPIVWIKSGAERYIPQPVQYRPLDALSVVVTAGLGVDNRVVVQGAPLIAQIR